MVHRPVATILILITTMILTLPAPAQQKPFTQDQVQGMLRSGLGDETGAKAIEQRGIDFTPTEDFLHSLKAAGANEAFLQALREAKRPRPTGATPKKPLNQVQVFALLAGQVSSYRVTMLVQERGIDFEPTDEYLQEVRLVGGEDELVSSLKSAKVTKPKHVDPALQARQAEIRQHLRRGIGFMQAKRFAQAETEYRAAVNLDPHNGDLHQSLGVALGDNGDRDGEIAEYREALRLNPYNDGAHNNLGLALGDRGDWNAGITELCEALRLNPDNFMWHDNLGLAFGHKDDWDAAGLEFRKALRLNPKDDFAHAGLGSVLEHERDPNGATLEYRTALALNPDNEWAHCNLGALLARGDDLDGAIAEERRALQLNPNDDRAHGILGLTLELKGDLQGALLELREACELNPSEPVHRKAYDRLLRLVNQQD